MQLLKSTKSIATALTMLLASHCAFALLEIDGAPAPKKTEGQPRPATPVAGESWLVHLNRPFNQTSMGKTGRLGPPASALGEQADHWLPTGAFSVTPQNTTLHGADLYRFNCQGCHGETGQGAPPEINSVINPVRATSVGLVMERMKATGMDISRADATKLAQQANVALLQRLHSGGESMPPFPHLDEMEVRALVAYLKQLVGVPGAEGQQIAVTESPLRVGEHIVKATCHTCHSATGADPTPQQIEDGAIPPLSVLAARRSQPEFIFKVTHGAPILMGTPPMLYRGRMPVFYYLSEQEAADVYLYLTTDPPSESDDRATVIALSQQGPAAGGGAPPQAGGKPFIPTGALVERPRPTKDTTLQTIILLSVVGSLVFLLLAGGLGFTMRELQRLSAAGANGPRVRNRDIREGVARPTGAMGRGVAPMSFGDVKR